MDEQPKIPTPSPVLLRELNYTYTPIVAFVIVAIIALVLWTKRLGPTTLLGEAETIDAIVSSPQPGVLAEASKDVNQALKTIAKKDVTDEHFAEANSALGVLEKTIAATDAKNAMLDPFVFDAKALLRDGKASTNQRRMEVDADLSQSSASTTCASVASAESCMRRLSRPALAQARSMASR